MNGKRWVASERAGWAVWLAWVVLLVLAALILAGRAAAQGPVNLLENPSFEGASQAQDGINELQVVPPWRVGYKQSQCKLPDWALAGSPSN